MATREEALAVFELLKVDLGNSLEVRDGFSLVVPISNCCPGKSVCKIYCSATTEEKLWDTAISVAQRETYRIRQRDQK